MKKFDLEDIVITVALVCQTVILLMATLAFVAVVPSVIWYLLTH